MRSERGERAISAFGFLVFLSIMLLAIGVEGEIVLGIVVAVVCFECSVFALSADDDVDKKP